MIRQFKVRKKGSLMPAALFTALYLGSLIVPLGCRATAQTPTLGTSIAPAIDGEMKKWHKITLTFDGPLASETGETNPFLNYRLNVIFSQGEKRYVVPGYFAADGDAADTSASSGTKWRAHFSPDATGEWNYTVSFRQGDHVAIEDNPQAGVPVAPLDGASGRFEVAPTDKGGIDLRAKGRLQYVNEHYLRFAETGGYFMKQGADSPENLLAYDDFDNTPNIRKLRKSWEPHVRDWRPGDPVWKGDKGKGLIGAINYLASERMNVFSFLTYTVGGDDQNVFPMLSDKKEDRTRYDCSKLDQWEVVFEHGIRMGMYLHFKLQERENDDLDLDGKKVTAALDDGELGVERKLYIRELIARFGHHLAMNWNLGEENSQAPPQQRAMAQYFVDHDPYGHLIVLHTVPGKLQQIYTPLLGDKSMLSGVSVQGGDNQYLDIYPKVAEWVAKSAAAGRKWVVANDEQGRGSYGILPDKDAGASHDRGRKRVIWGTVLAGGAGAEYYFGARYDHSDMTCQDFRSRDRWWDYARYVLEFFEASQAPFWRMSPDNSLISGEGNWAMAEPGKACIVYLPNGGEATLDLSTFDGECSIRWFNPREGGSMKMGSVAKAQGGKKVSLGAPPSDADQDWVVYVASLKP